MLFQGTPMLIKHINGSAADRFFPTVSCNSLLARMFIQHMMSGRLGDFDASEEEVGQRHSKLEDISLQDWIIAKMLRTPTPSPPSFK